MRRRGGGRTDKAAEYLQFREFQEVLELETGYTREGLSRAYVFALRTFTTAAIADIAAVFAPRRFAREFNE